MTMRSRGSWVLKMALLSLLSAMPILAGCDKGTDTGSKPSPDGNQKARALARLAVVRRIASTYGARVISSESMKAVPYTEELRRSLVGSDGTPIAFSGEIWDVRKSGEGYILLILSDYPAGDTVSLDLRCDLPIAQRAMTIDERDRPVDCIIVARITGLRPAAPSDRVPGLDDSLQPPFKADGQCLDFVKVIGGD